MAARIELRKVLREGAGVQRKVFRVEQMIGRHSASAVALRAGEDRGAPQRDTSIQSELTRVRAIITENRRDLSAIIGDRNKRHMALAAGELGAAVEGMEKATQRILKSAESIDDEARALTSALKSEFERGLAQDIQDKVVHIYEACNFQDLAGQRIAKVIATLGAIEQQLGAMLARCGETEVASAETARDASGLINGPRLDGASGHVSQSDIDALFD
jgi:chemotaxis protein CheZ